MNNINWSNFSPDKFQLFCNAILSFEISKRYVPFSASGKDGGIDGKYEGAYDGKTGLWRFQDKFHEGTRSEVISRLKKDMKKETKNVTTEDFFILLTNFELLPQQQDDLIEIGYSSLLQRKKKLIIEVWDGAKLFTFYIKFPILKMWMEDGFTTAKLVKYKDYFANALSASIDKPFTLSNDLIPRVTEVQKLDNFLRLEDKKFALLTGEVGIGKTRLAIDFFLQKIDDRDDWEVLVLQSHDIDVDKLSFALNGEINYLVLIDDAHTYSVADIMDIRNIAIPKGKKKVKFILTASSIAWYDSFKLLSPHIIEEIETIPLEKFSIEYTTEFFTKQLANTHYADFVSNLVEISHGRPILIVALLRAMYQGIRVSDIKKEGFLNNYVLNYFNLFIKKLQNKTGLSNFKLENCIRLVCLLEPFDYLSEKVQQSIASTLAIEDEQLVLILQELINDGLAIGSFTYYYIKPDYYSDIFLKKANENWIKDKVEKYPLYIPNIIRNLNSVDEANENLANNPSILDTILEMYIEKVENVSVVSDISPIAETIHSVAYFKPKIAALFLQKVMHQMNQSGNEMQQDLVKHKEYYISSPFSIFATVKLILFDLLYHKNMYPFVFEACLVFYKLTMDKAIFKNTWDFSWMERVEHYQLNKQFFFINKAIFILQDRNYSDILYFIECFSELLKLEFRGTSSNSLNGRAMTITTYFIPSTDTVKKLRQKIILELITLYDSINEEIIRQRILDQILDVPRDILSTQRNTMPYEGGQEIKSVLQFLLEFADSFGQKEKKSVLIHLHRYRLWHIPEDFNWLILQIEVKLKPVTLVDQLNDIILRADLNNDMDMHTIAREIKQEYRPIIAIHTGDTLAKAVSALLTPDIQPSNYFWPFLDILKDEFPDKTKSFYETIYQARKDLLYILGSYILRYLYINKGEIDFYWQYITLLEEEDNKEARNVILHIYAYNLPPECKLSPRDLTLLNRTYEKRSPDNDLLMGLSLITILNTDENMFDRMAPDYLQTCSQKSAERFFYNLFQQEEQHFNRSALLLLKCTVHLNVTYEIEQCLIQIISKMGFGGVFAYFLDRYAHLLNLINTKGAFYRYEWVPVTIESRFITSFTKEVNTEIYKQILNWYVTEDFKDTNTYFGKQLLDYFSFSKTLTKELDNIYREYLQGERKNGLRAIRLVESLCLFEIKNDKLIELVIDYWKSGNVALINEQDILSSFNIACSVALWHVGHKMGRPGEPFKEDLTLKDILMQAIEHHKEDAQTISFLDNVLQIVSKAISRDSARGKELW